MFYISKIPDKLWNIHGPFDQCLETPEYTTYVSNTLLQEDYVHYLCLFIIVLIGFIVLMLFWWVHLHLHFYSLIKLIFFRILFKFMWDHTVKAITGKIQPFDILYFRSSKVQFSAQVKDFFRPKWNSNPPKWKMPVLIRCDSLNNRNKQK